MTSQFNLTSSNKWVTWGGSYPGMVAGLSRLRFPHLIHASVSSSAPLQAQVDMRGYNDVVAQSMASVDVGGSPACNQAIVDGHVTIGEMLKTTEGRTNLTTMFNICSGSRNSLEVEANRVEFAGYGVVYLPAQVPCAFSDPHRIILLINAHLLNVSLV